MKRCLAKKINLSGKSALKLIKDGKPFKMSKRKGDYITEDLADEVGKDATRFIMLNRSNDAEIDFDFSKVKEKPKDNPLYYVHYVMPEFHLCLEILIKISMIKQIYQNIILNIQKMK